MITVNDRWAIMFCSKVYTGSCCYLFDTVFTFELENLDTSGLVG